MYSVYFYRFAFILIAKRFENILFYQLKKKDNLVYLLLKSDFPEYWKNKYSIAFVYIQGKQTLLVKCMFLYLLFVLTDLRYTDLFQIIFWINEGIDRLSLAGAQQC